MKLFNSLTRKLEVFESINKKSVGVYTCGPTVYDYVTIGNWRTYTLGDFLVRTLKYLEYHVDYVMNITDVGHLTGDNLGDADTGEDRLEKAAKKSGKTAWDIAEFYTQDFLAGFAKLNLTQPNTFCKATEHIIEQIDMVKQIEAKGFTYKISDGIYFDTKAFEAAGNVYGELSNIDQVKEGARVEPNPEKKDPRDFALWKFSTSEENRQMEWDSPWGKGFPGWHIECSAMSRKYLGEQFDIHLGGEDLKSTHHPNEIAQAEAATGKKPFVKYWLHGAFLRVDGKRMGKSLGNAYTLTDLEARGFSPADLRYFYMTGHYRKPLNFTWEGMEAAKKSLERLRLKISSYKLQTTNDQTIDTSVLEPAIGSFTQALEDDLNMPQALAVVWQVLDDVHLSPAEKVAVLQKFDLVLGLELEAVSDLLGLDLNGLPQEIFDLVKARETARKEKDFKTSDNLRKQITDKGYSIEDTANGQIVKKIS